MTSKCSFRSLGKSRILIAVKEAQDALAPVDLSTFQRQIFYLLKKTKGEPSLRRLVAQTIHQHLRKRTAFPRVRIVSSASAFRCAVKEGVCVVDFFTRWFPVTSPRLLELEGISKALCPQSSVVMVDLEAAPQLTLQLSIVVLPTLLIYSDGSLLKRCVGGLTRRQLGVIFGTIRSNQGLGEASLERGKSIPTSATSPQRS